VLDVRTGRSRQLTRDPGADEFASCSSDGRIAFAGERAGERGIWVIDADGANVLALTG
jgi:Tol biopolymer transport system component